ncbi:Transcription elongation factor Spt4 [uncultured archaeon]|nr:Transcription elongation factor Spt4 [uncultured archaeon]
MAERVCKDCHRLIKEKYTACEDCKSTTFTTDWSGYVVIIDPLKSQIAKKLNIKLAGSYALKVR